MQVKEVRPPFGFGSKRGGMRWVIPIPNIYRVFAYLMTDRSLFSLNLIIHILSLLRDYNLEMSTDTSDYTIMLPRSYIVALLRLILQSIDCGLEPLQ